MFILQTLKIAGLMTLSHPIKLILRGNVYEGKYEQLETLIPITLRLGDNGKHVP